MEVSGGSAAKRFTEERSQGAVYRLRITLDQGADEVTLTVPVGVAEAKDDPSNINAEGRETFALAPGAPTRQSEPLTARFEDLPEEHDGTSAFEFELRFSEGPENLSYVTLRDQAFAVTGGTVRAASRKDGNRRWTIRVEPDSRDAVVITLPGDRACDATGAICMEDGRRLSNSPSATVAGPPLELLTANFSGVPAEHDGTSGDRPLSLAGLQGQRPDHPVGRHRIRQGRPDVDAWRGNGGSGAGCRWP